VLSKHTKIVTYNPKRFVGEPDNEVVNVINNIRVSSKNDNFAADL